MPGFAGWVGAGWVRERFAVLAGDSSLSGPLGSVFPAAGSRAHKHERSLHVHGHRDELQMTGVAGASQIADAAHSIPALHGGEGGSTAERALATGVMEPLPGLERIAGIDLPGDPRRPARVQSLAVIAPVGEKALLVALDQRFAQTSVVHIGRGRSARAPSALLVHRQMRLIAE
jgi:hypothetical protein